MTSFAVEQALRHLDDSARNDARAALESLLPEHGDWADLLQLTLQEFLWYHLPVKWLTDSSHHHEVAWALGDLFEAAGLDRYAGLCRSAATHELIAQWADNREEARERFRGLVADSGVNPPDTPLLTWGSMQGLSEYAAGLHVSAALEAAVVEGSLVPGRRGWRSVAAAVTERTLRGPDPHGEHSCLLARVETDRRRDWLAETQRRIGLTGEPAATLAAHLASPPTDDVVHAVAASLEPLVWFLSQIGDGLNLTERGYLPRRLALDADERYAWFDLRPKFTVRGERDLPELTLIHALARETRLVTLRRGRLTLSAQGRAALADEPSLVRAILSVIFAPTTWEGDAAVGMAVALACADPATRVSTADLDAALHRHLQARWRAGASDLTVADVRGAGRRLDSSGRVFAWFAPAERGVWDRAPQLTEVGRHALLLGLRMVACAPRG